LNQLAVAGRTNDIHQACEEFEREFVISSREEDVSNFNSLAMDTFEKSELQTTSTTNKP
jgi:hypothetical protein